MNESGEMRDDYGNVLKDVRGKYYERVGDGVRAVLLDADVAGVFTDGRQINDILRALVPTMRKQAS